jgi:hypothetical protein
MTQMSYACSLMPTRLFVFVYELTPLDALSAARNLMRPQIEIANRNEGAIRLCGTALFRFK